MMTGPTDDRQNGRQRETHTHRETGGVQQPPPQKKKKQKHILLGDWLAGRQQYGSLRIFTIIAQISTTRRIISDVSTDLWLARCWVGLLLLASSRRPRSEEPPERPSDHQRWVACFVRHVEPVWLDMLYDLVA